jgi:hypothetical protein
MRGMATGAAFHCAYLHATQRAFLEADELAFAWFGGHFEAFGSILFPGTKCRAFLTHRRGDHASINCTKLHAPRR